MTPRHIAQREMSEGQRAYFDAWMVYHGVNLHEAHTLEFTRDGHLNVSYRVAGPVHVPVELMVPAWL